MIPAIAFSSEFEPMPNTPGAEGCVTSARVGLSGCGCVVSFFTTKGRDGDGTEVSEALANSESETLLAEGFCAGDSVPAAVECVVISGAMTEEAAGADAGL